MANCSSSEWINYSIDEIKADFKGAIAIGPFGSRMKSECYTERGIPVIRGNNISATKELIGDFACISNELADELSISNVFEGDLVFPHRGLIGEVGIVGKNEPRYVLSSSLMKLTCNKNIVDPLFLFYFFRSPLGKHELLKNASQVGTPGIATPLASLKSIHVSLPPLPEQRAIARIIGTLDDKIELNCRMNETLEAIARAIFKSWFVDFDPVRARAEGRAPVGMDAKTAALFPDSFEETELGMVPKEWEVKIIGDALELAYGKALKEEFRRPGKIPVFGSNGQVGWHDEKLADGPGIIVGRKGNPGTITWSQTEFISIDTTFYVKPKELCKSMHYLFFILRNQNLASLGADSAVPGLNRNLAYLSKMIVPSVNILKTFDKHIAVIYEKIHANDEQSRNIAAIRDLLMSKLVRGEIRVEN